MRVNPFWLLFGLEGRVIRAHWWFGMAILALAFIAINRGLHHHFEHVVGLAPTQQLDSRLGLITLLVLIYPQIALCQKRLQDRGWGAVMITVLVGIPIGTMIIAFSGLPQVLPADAQWWTITQDVALLGCLWALIEMGARGGQLADNHYGPYPLGEEPPRYSWNTTERQVVRPDRPVNPQPGPSLSQVATKLRDQAQALRDLGQARG